MMHISLWKLSKEHQHTGKNEVLATVRQLRLPTFFMTLSCADLRWNELISIIATLQGETLIDNDIKEMDFFDRCSFLNLNPVLLARHFQYRVGIILSGYCFKWATRKSQISCYSS